MQTLSGLQAIYEKELFQLLEELEVITNLVNTQDEHLNRLEVCEVCGLRNLDDFINECACYNKICFKCMEKSDSWRYEEKRHCFICVDCGNVFKIFSRC
jgi:hypothetical protein